MALKTIPLNLDWCGSDAKEDFHAIYERREENNWGEPVLDAQGREQWHLTSALPLRRHPDWTKKGFRYLTIAITPEDHAWPKVAAWIRQQTGADPFTFIQDRRTRSTFSLAAYLEGAQVAREKAFEDLRALVRQYGAEAVLEIKRQTDPHFVLPDGLRDDAPEPMAAEPDDSPAPVSDPPKRKRGRPRKEPAAA